MQPIFSSLYHSALAHLTVTPVALGVLELPGVATASLGVVVAVTLVDTTGLLAGGSETTSLAVLRKKISSVWLFRGKRFVGLGISPCGRGCRSS
jgi:hypothetical protein